MWRVKAKGTVGRTGAAVRYMLARPLGVMVRGPSMAELVERAWAGWDEVMG